MTNQSLDFYKETLELFLEDFKRYQNGNTQIKRNLQQRIPLIANIILIVHGGGNLKLKFNKDPFNFRMALGYYLTGSLSMEDRRFVGSNIELTINEAIGNIINDTIPNSEIIPILPLKDEELRRRCLHLLDESHPLDTVIRESTVILEHRLRGKLSHEKLSEIIPLASDQIGENLITKLLSPNDAKIVISENKAERNAFFKMMLGVAAPAL